MMVFDLDPDEGMDIEKVRQGVRDIKSILSELSLVSYLKTSGGKGYHVVVPLKPAVNWDAFHDFARKVAEVMEQKWPDRYTVMSEKLSVSAKYLSTGLGMPGEPPALLLFIKSQKRCESFHACLLG